MLSSQGGVKENASPSVPADKYVYAQIASNWLKVNDGKQILNWVTGYWINGFGLVMGQFVRPVV